MQRLTKQYPSGRITLDAEQFNLAQEALDGKIHAEPVLHKVLERLFEYENEVTYCEDCIHSKYYSGDKFICDNYGLKRRNDFCSDGSKEVHNG